MIYLKLVSLLMALVKNGTDLIHCWGYFFIISVESGEVLDNEVKSKFCFKCNARGQWDKNSDIIKVGICRMKTYRINHTSLSESVEKFATVEMLRRSFSLHNLKYTTYVGDEDSSLFGEICEAMKNK